MRYMRHKVTGQIQPVHPLLMKQDDMELIEVADDKVIKNVRGNATVPAAKPRGRPSQKVKVIDPEAEQAAADAEALAMHQAQQAAQAAGADETAAMLDVVLSDEDLEAAGKEDSDADDAG